MPYRYEMYRRLEPAQPFESLQRGFLAEVHDPVWFLGRQWQLGEHQGEDASSPVAVRFRASHQPIVTPPAGSPFDPTVVPPEAIVESEPGDWWTPGRRVRIGAAALAAARTASTPLPPVATADPALLLHDLPVPYDRLDGGGYDGQTLFERRARLGLVGLSPDPFADVPAHPPTDAWDPAELAYAANFACAGRTLRLERHTGGRVDWYSVDADGPLAPPNPLPGQAQVFPGRVRYPGAPHPRWWEIEDARVDVGGFPPDRTHFATMLLIDLVVSHSDDWFMFPVSTRAGHVVTLHEVLVRDAFGDEWAVTPPAGWWLFAVTGLAETSLVVWPTVTTPLSGPVLEDVALGVDEDANLLWAVERRVLGRDVPTAARGRVPDGQTAGGPAPVTDATSRRQYTYAPSTPMAAHWHPYEIGDINGRRRFVQGRLAELAANPPALAPEPRARVLSDPAAVPPAPAHVIEPATVPSLGLRLERRYMLARGTDGRPVLWAQRRRIPLLAPPAPGLRFDVMKDESPGAP